MAAAPHDGAPPHLENDAEAASGRPFGMRAFYREHAERLLDAGYEPVPLVPRQKRPAVDAWSTIPIDTAQVAAWVARHPGCGVGLRTGRLVAVDIDLDDPDLAHQAAALTEAMLGPTILRIGRWPRRLLLYRIATLIPKLAIPGVEILGAGQQVVAFGIHPVTGDPYAWPEGSPLDTALEQLPRVDEAALRGLLAELAQILPGASGTDAGASGRKHGGRGGGAGTGAAAGAGGGAAGPVRGAEGRVVDGRDAWLSAIAFHVVRDALDAGGVPKPEALAARAWERFAATADLDRPKSGGTRPYAPGDAARKVADKLRLWSEGRLPGRTHEGVAPPPELELLPVDVARAALAAAIQDACDRVHAWHVAPLRGYAPQIGIRATVGLGKSVLARDAILRLRARLGRSDAPFRMVVATPSHALAEETAAAFRKCGASVAVLRGFERQHPVLGAPMCRDLPAVRAALAAGENVQSSVCADAAGRRCRHHDGCLKQANRAELAGAEIVVAPYDALYSGLPMRADEVALILIDEGCWPRALEETSRISLADFLAATAAGGDLDALRGRAGAAFATSGEGPVSGTALRMAGLCVESAERAAELELRRMRDPGFAPGQGAAARDAAMKQAALNAEARACAALWRAMARLLTGEAETDGRVRVEQEEVEGGATVVALGVKPLHVALRGRPVLHLDATLRADLAGAILPMLETTAIEAETPHAELRLIAGRFGKRRICPTAAWSREERRRRENRLGEAVDYVRWHAARFIGKRTLVVTYADCEPAFAAIPGVETAHFNAVAGLDIWRDVALLIVVGRPLPPEPEIRRGAAAFFGHEPEGGYTPALQGVRLRNGDVAAVTIFRHADPLAEILRAAICDDEIMQAIGRARAVNRTARNPVEIHVLADVALPLVHDRVRDWEAERPTPIQGMLLAGLATDGPADAAALHPGLFPTVEAAKKAYQREGFRGHFPLRSSMWEVSLKSAAYRRPGRGRGWRRCWWIADDASAARAVLERAIGPLAEWRPD